MFSRQITVGDHERALVARNGRFHRIFSPGRYRVFRVPGLSLDVTTFDSRSLLFQSQWANFLVQQRPDVVAQHFITVETTELQVAMVYADGKLCTVLAPKQRVLLWRGVAEITTEIVEVLGEPDSDWEDSPEGFDDLLVEAE